VSDTLPAFPLHKYFSNAVDFGVGTGFVESRIRWSNLSSCTSVSNTGFHSTPSNGSTKKATEIITGRNDLDIDLTGAVDMPGEVTEEARMVLAIENSYQFTHWHGMVIGALTNALVGSADRPVPPVDTEIDTRIGKMSQASSQGLRIGAPDLSETTFKQLKARVVVAVSIDGGVVEKVKKKFLKPICQEALQEMRRCGYPWVDNAWIVWCHFPSSGDFVDSLVGVRALVPDHTTERAIGEDSVGKPLTYMVQSRQRQPPAAQCARRPASPPSLHSWRCEPCERSRQK